MSLILIALITMLLAAANGANDNVKGAATLIGSGVIGYRSAIALATLATALGGVASIFLANGLLAAFSGKGIVASELTASLPFLQAVGLGAALTIGLGTRLGLPLSTTHALLGGLLGAGLAADAANVSYLATSKAMLLPLVVSPLVAMLFAVSIVPWLRRRRTAAACVCVDVEPELVPESAALAFAGTTITFGTPSQTECQPAPGRSARVITASTWLDRSHLFSAAAVSFARGLNDTPKIAALLFAAGTVGVANASLLVIAPMALGGWLASRRVADTLAFRVTRMDASEGLGGNLVTAALVVIASRFGMPVSTTHVSTGALFGIALENRGGHWLVIRNILLAWLGTLPLAAVLAYLAHLLIS
ncbi:MAG: inorganic phosphate transporter [Arenimonas sp.]|jgi:PiT family inorganic phosphate transporter